MRRREIVENGVLYQWKNSICIERKVNKNSKNAIISNNNRIILIKQYEGFYRALLPTLDHKYNNMTLEKAGNVSEQSVDIWEFRYNLIETLLAMEADNARRELEEN